MTEESLLAEHYRKGNREYHKGWSAALRLFLRNGEVDKEKENPFEPGTEEWFGFVASCDYRWKVAVE